MYGSDGLALIDLLQFPGEAAPEVGKRVLCRHPLEESKRAYARPTRIERLYSTVWAEGKVVSKIPSLEEIRENVSRSLGVLRPDHKRSLNPTPYKVAVSNDLYNFVHDLWLRNAPIGKLS